MLKFLPFGAFDPDGPRYAEQGLDRCTNFLPIHRGYRLMRSINQVITDDTAVQSDESTSETADNYPVSGTLALIKLVDTAAQVATPSSVEDAATETWVNQNGEDAETDNWLDAIDPLNEDDGTYIAHGGAPSPNTITIVLDDLDTPGSTSDHEIRIRYQIINHVNSSGGSLVVKLLESDDTEVTSQTINFTADTDGFVEWSYTLSGGEATAMTDYTGAKLQFQLTTEGPEQQAVPSEDLENDDNWASIGESTLWEATDDGLSPDDATTYIRSPVLGDDESSSVTLGLSQITSPQTTDAYLALASITARKAYLTSGDVDVTYDFYSGQDLLLSDTDQGKTPQAWNSVTGNILDDPPLDLADIQVKVTATRNGQHANAYKTQVSPDTDIADGTWVDEGGGTTDLSGGITYGSGNSTYITTTSTVDDLFKTNLGTYTYPKVSNDYKIKMVARQPSDGDVDVRCRLYKILSGVNEILIQSWTQTVSGDTFTTYSSSALGSSAVAKISGTFQLRLVIDVAETTATEVEISQAYLEHPMPTQLYLTMVRLGLPSTSGGRISYARFKVPSATTYSKGDQSLVVAGTRDNLWQVQSQQWVQRTNTTDYASGYGQGGTQPMSWSLAQWGNDVVATNWSDAPQQWTDGDAQFDDMVDTASKGPDPAPKAKCIAVVRNQVVLGNIKGTWSPPGDPAPSAGTGDMVWWSAVDDSSDFRVDLTTQCDYQRLLDTPGQVTSIVGGEYGIIFKGNSVYRMSFVGYPLTYSFSVLSHHIGCPYPRSIVAIGRDILFWTGSGFAVVRNGSEVSYLDSSTVDRWMGDQDHSSYSYRSSTAQEVWKTDADVFGAYDPYSKTVFWAYRQVGGTENQCDSILTFHVPTRTWGYIENSNLNCSAMVNMKNIVNNQTHVTKGLGVFQWDGSVNKFSRFNGTTTYQGTIRTKVFHLGNGQDVLLRKLRPLWTLIPDSETSPNLTITVETSSDPHMQNNVVTTTFGDSGRANLVPNRDGWYVERATGEFFRFTLVWTANANSATRELTGLLLDIQGEETAPL